MVALSDDAAIWSANSTSRVSLRRAVLFVTSPSAGVPESVPAPVGTSACNLPYTVGISMATVLPRPGQRGRTKSKPDRTDRCLLRARCDLAFVQARNLACPRLFAGSGTNTPALQAAINTLGNDDPAVGYSVAYPFGVAGPILLLQMAFLILQPKVEIPTSAGQELLEIEIRNPALIGKCLAEVTATLPTGVQIAAVRRDHRNQIALPEHKLDGNDVLLAVSSSKSCSNRPSGSLPAPSAASSATAATWIIFASSCPDPQW